MKTLKRILVTILSLCLFASVATMIACGGGNDGGDTPSGYTVTFMVEGEQYGNQQTVQRGRRVTEPAEPTFSVAGYVFTGWFTTETFDSNSKWNFATGIVTENLTLYAGYRVVTAHVSEVAKADEPVTSKLVWTQAQASQATDYTVTITNASGTTTLTGDVAFDSANYKVTFTPSVIPQGGTYTVSVVDNTKTESACVVENVLFNGAGTELNPYLVASELDFKAVNGANVSEGTIFSLVKSISITTNRDAQKDYVFNGTLIGNGRTITITGNSGAIYKVGENGIVKQVSIAGAISTSLYDSIGTVVDYNAGRVEKVSVTANVESTAGTVGTSGIEKALNETLADGAGNRGIAGGVVGTNLASGVVYNCKITTSSSSTGTIKARIGGGTIVGYNKGTVEMCTSEGCLGAWNSKETGKSTSNYSYGGGIVGINAGSVTKCAVQGSGKLLAQRITNEGSIVEGTTNANIGGIAGYNMANGTIGECYFAGIRVHGDENVGGIAGLNAGAISDCYVAGAYSSTTTIYTYVGGRTNVGGLVGKTETGSTVANCFVTANVYAYGTNGVAYAASQNANNVVYLTANLNAKSKDDTNVNPDPASIIAPVGTGNVAVEVVYGSADGVTTDYALAESYLATVNGNEKFFFEETIKLAFIKNIPAELTMNIGLYNADGSFYADDVVAETGAAVAGPVVKGYVFVGWATELNGDVVFAKGSAISMYDLLDYAGSDGTVKLYAVMEVRIPNEGLIVAVYDRYIDTLVEGSSQAIEDAFASWMEGQGYTYSVEFRHYAGDKLAVADFGAAVNSDGDIDVIIGAGANISSQGKVDYIARAYMTYDGLTARYAVLLTDTERAIDFYAFVAGLEVGTATVKFDVDGTITEGEVDGIYGTTVTAPSVVAPENYEFIGWATTQGATEAQITESKIGYALVKDYIVSGVVTLYPVFEQVVVEEPEEETDVTLKVSVWTKGGDWVTEAELNAVKSGFLSYLVGQGVDTSKITITYVETSTSKVADLGKEVNDAGDYDFIIGCGKNVTSGGGVVTVDKQEMATSVFAAGRYVAILTDNTLAVHLYNYFTSINA